jgi:hypothetical protein
MTPFLYLGAVVTREPLLDIYVTARSAFRITPRATLIRVDPAGRQEERVSMRDFAASIIEHRRGAGLNDGIRVLAHRGSWGWLSFDDPEDFDNYSFWLYTLLMSRRPAFRYR